MSLRTIPQSHDGVTKATRFYEVTSLSSHSSALPALVVAVRGTLSTRAVDWLVNFNHHPISPGDLIVS